MKKVSVIYQKNAKYTHFLSNNILEGIYLEKLQGDLLSTCEIENNVNVLNKYDGIVFGSPTYFGSVSAEIKSLMDKTSKIWQKKMWCDKIAAGYTYSSALSGDKLGVLTQFFIFAQQHGMLWVGLDIPCCYKDNKGNLLNFMGSWSGLMGQSPNKITGEKSIKSDKATANYFGRRISKIIKKF